METIYLNIPCLTVTKNTERPFTIIRGTNLLIGMKRYVIVEESFQILNGTKKQSVNMSLWDGKAAERIVEILLLSVD